MPVPLNGRPWNPQFLRDIDLFEPLTLQFLDLSASSGSSNAGRMRCIHCMS